MQSESQQQTYSFCCRLLRYFLTRYRAEGESSAPIAAAAAVVAAVVIAYSLPVAVGGNDDYNHGCCC